MEIHALVFHEWANCPGVITTKRIGETVQLRCAECAAIVGTVQPGFLEQMNIVFATVPRKP